MAYVDFILKLHRSTPRDYVRRVVEHDKAECAAVACQFGKEYWDGERHFGYGGHHGLTPASRILDVGCGKGFLLYEFTQVIPGAQVAGIDVSQYAIDHAKE